MGRSLPSRFAHTKDGSYSAGATPAQKLCIRNWPSINSYTPPSVGFSSTYTTLPAGEAEAVVAAIAEVHGKSCRGPPRNGFEQKWLRINVRPKLARRPAQSDTSDVRLEEQTVESDKSREGGGRENRFSAEAQGSPTTF